MKGGLTDKIRLLHILDAINNIEKYLSSVSCEAFREDQKTVDAVVRNLEIIGEATNKLGKIFLFEHPSLPYAEIVGMRNIIIHEYFRVDYDIIWRIYEQRLPELKKIIEQIIKGLEYQTKNCELLQH